MMFITDGYTGRKSESFRGYCSFLEECTSIILLHYYIEASRQALVFCNRQVTVLQLNSRMLYNDLVWHTCMFWVVFFSHHETVGVVLSLSTQPFSTALISNTELPSLSAILRLFYLHQVNQQRNKEYNVLLMSWIHTRIHNGQSLKYRLSNSS